MVLITIVIFKWIQRNTVTVETKLILKTVLVEFSKFNASIAVAVEKSQQKMKT